MTPTDTPAAQAAAGDVWRVVLADGDVGVCVPRDCEDGSWSAVVRWPGGAMSRADGSDAGQAVWRAAVERCEWLYGRDDVAAYVVEVLAPGESPRAELAHRAEQGAVDTARIDRALATIDALTRERDRLTADLARLRAPSPELAAIGARHQERLALPRYVVAGPRVEGDRRTLSPLPPTQLDADIGTLLAHIAAQQAAHAAALDGARAAALREGLLRGLALAQEHAAPYIDDDMGAPQVDWTDAVAAVGDATTVAPSAAPTAPSIGAVRAAAVSAFAMWLRRHKTPAGPWTLAKEAEEEGAAVIGELIEAALAAPRGR